jgi:xylulokinase
MQAFGTALEWASGVLGAGEGLDSFFDGRTQRTLPRPALLFLPYLLGERAPYWDPLAKGAFVGLTPQHTAADMGAAVLQGLGMHLRLIADAFAAENMSAVPLPIVGGAVRIRSVFQAIANGLGRAVAEIDGGAEATSRGAFVATAIANGILADYRSARSLVRVTRIWEPDADAAAALSALVPVFQKTFEQLRPVFASLANTPDPSQLLEGTRT